MPNRLYRYYGPDISTSLLRVCHRRRPLLGTAHSRDLFLEVMEQVRQRYRFVVVANFIQYEEIIGRGERI